MELSTEGYMQNPLINSLLVLIILYIKLNKYPFQ
jgi:hypothetical protein